MSQTEVTTQQNSELVQPFSQTVLQFLDTATCIVNTIYNIMICMLFLCVAAYFLNGHFSIFGILNWIIVSIRKFMVFVIKVVLNNSWIIISKIMSVLYNIIPDFFTSAVKKIFS